MIGVFTSSMGAPPHNPLCVPADIKSPTMHELWEYRTHEQATRPMREYVDTLWVAKTIRRKPSPTNGFPCTVILAQRDIPGGRLIYFHDLGLRQRFPGAHRVDAHSLLPASLRWRNRKIPFEDRIYWESQQKQWLELWRAEYAEYRLPLAERRRFDVVGRVRDWWQPRCGYQAVLASEMSIERIGHNWQMTDYSYLREAIVEGGGDAHFSHAFDWWEQPLLFAKCFEPMQLQAGLAKAWSRVWFVSNDKSCPEFPQHLDCVDPPREPGCFVNHRTLCPGQPSEGWGGAIALLAKDHRASGPRRNAIDWLTKHKPA